MKTKLFSEGCFLKLNEEKAGLGYFQTAILPENRLGMFPNNWRAGIGNDL